MTDVTNHQKAILDLETEWPVYGWDKDHAIRALGLTPAGYYQTLHQLIDTRPALEYAPITVERVRRLRNNQHRIDRGNN